MEGGKGKRRRRRKVWMAAATLFFVPGAYAPLTPP